jgi:hypothetical protein
MVDFEALGSTVCNVFLSVEKNRLREGETLTESMRLNVGKPELFINQIGCRQEIRNNGTGK